MDTAYAISPEMLDKFRNAFDRNKVSQVAAKAASKTCADDICYDLQQAKKMSHRFSVDIPTMEAANQQASGRCWIFAALNLLREKLGKKLNVAQLELSESYISFFDHLEKANTFLEDMLETGNEELDDRFVSMRLTAPVGDGGWWEYFAGLCKKYGVVPKDAMPETYQSSHSDSMNMLLNMQLRKDALQIRRELAAGKTVQQVRPLKTQMLSRVYNLLCIFLGTPPEKFDFEYVDKDSAYHAQRDLTPLEFYDGFIGVDLDQIAGIINAPVSGIPFYKTYVTKGEESIRGGYQAKRLNLPLEEFKAAVLRQLEDGEPVWFVCDCDYYGCTKEGIWDTGLFDYETPFGLDFQMEKGELMQYRQTSLNHAMVLTGVNLVDGKPDKWKIQNSWGTEKGNNGYFIMSDAWFDRYVFTANIELRFLTQQQREQFRQDPVVMPLWSILA